MSVSEHKNIMRFCV